MNPGSADRLVGIKEWYNRGYLPHRTKSGLLQMITYRLADSLPDQVLQKMQREIQLLPTEKQDIAQRKRIEDWIDSGHGSCLLQEPEIAELIIENWKFYSKDRYDLIAYVIMPNHVHVMINDKGKVPLGKTVQAWKGYTGKKIKEWLINNADQTVGAPRLGTSIWHREYWDRFIRDEDHFANSIDYILNNPVKSGLVNDLSKWPWSYTITT